MEIFTELQLSYSFENIKMKKTDLFSINTWKRSRLICKYVCFDSKWQSIIVTKYIIFT